MRSEKALVRSSAERLFAGSGFSAYTTSPRARPEALNSKPSVGCFEPMMGVRLRTPARVACAKKRRAPSGEEANTGAAPTTAMGSRRGARRRHSDTDENWRPGPT